MPTFANEEYGDYICVSQNSMIDNKTAKKIGYKQAFQAITIGLVVAYLIFATMAGPLWLFQVDYSPILIFAALVLYGIGYLFGGMAGKFIIVNKYPSVVIGIVTGFLIVWTGTFVGSLIGFFGEGLSNNSSVIEPFNDYILKPILMVSFWGFVPIVGVGIWYGLSINRRAKRTGTV